MLFGQELSKPLLIDFLNNLLKGERKIKNITFLDKELPAEFEDDRSLIYDILCETDDEEKIIVEMQNRGQTYFKKRSIYTMLLKLYRAKECEERNGNTTFTPFILWHS